MAAEKLSMRKLRELFRLRFEAKLTWPLPPELDDDAALTALLFPEHVELEGHWYSVPTPLAIAAVVLGRLGTSD